MKICPFLEEKPVVPASAYVAESAILEGAIVLGEHSSVWHQAVLRADIERIQIGRGTNIQDGTIIHLASDRGTMVGDFSSIGHRALLHACTIGDEVLVGMGAIVMDGAEVGSRSIVGAGSLVTRGTIIPPGSLVMGSPATVVRTLEAKEQSGIRKWAEKYITVSAEHVKARAAASPRVP